MNFVNQTAKPSLVKKKKFSISPSTSYAAEYARQATDLYDMKCKVTNKEN